MAQNEALFREVNERINDVAVNHGIGTIYEYLCGCANAECTFRLQLREGGYGKVRADLTGLLCCPSTSHLIGRYIARKIQSGLSPKRVHNQLLVLQVMLKRAVRWRLINHNPVSDCYRPRLQQAELNVPTETEIARLATAYNQLIENAEAGELAWWRLARNGPRTAALLAERWQHTHFQGDDELIFCHPDKVFHACPA
jgi:hypothetical protein